MFKYGELNDICIYGNIQLQGIFIFTHDVNIKQMGGQ